MGRIKDSTGERFIHVVPHPNTAGVYGKEGTVGEYVEVQGLAPYFEAVDTYLDLFNQISELVGGETEVTIGPLVDEDALVDVDAVNAQYCERKGLALPESADARFRCHVAAIQELILTEQVS